MCIAFPGKIISINKNNVAVIDISGTKCEVCLDIVDEDVAIGDYVISHAGYVIHKIDEQTALENLELLRQIMENEIH
jgi:hydrogenase expression/formation protein HypC